MRTILIVEDNELNRDMLSRRLMRRGYHVVCATSGHEALRVTADRMPDVVLMDIGLPEMDGLEATRRLKASEATRGIPIIALTAHALVTDRDSALSAGCDDFDTKPVDFARLIGKIDRLLLEGAA